MSIDRIGKGGAPPVGPEATEARGGLEKKSAVSAPFAVDRAERAASATATTGVEATSPLARLQAGELDVHGYIEAKVDEATRGLHGLSPAEIDDIKGVLREQLAADPDLRALVQAATGQSPQIPDE